MPPNRSIARDGLTTPEAVVPEPSSYTVVREILSADMKLTADEVITRAKAKGVTKSDADIRKVVHDTRKNLKDKNRKQRRRANAPPSPYTVARQVLTADPDLSTEEVFARVKERGVTKADSDIREAIHTTRSDLRRKGARTVPAATRVTNEPKPIALDEARVFAGVILANKTARLCGGVAKAREIVEAIRACGGTDTFLKQLELVAEIIGSDTKL